MNFLRTDARLPWFGKIALTLLPVLLLCFAYVKRSSELAETDRAKLMPTVGKLVDAAERVALPLPAPERESRKELRMERQFMIFKDTAASLKRMAWAMAVILLAVPLGVMMGSYPWAESLGKTIMVILSMIAGESISAEAGIGYRIFIKFYRTTAMDSTIVYVIWLTLLMFLLDAAISLWIKHRYKWLAGS